MSSSFCSVMPDVYRPPLPPNMSLRTANGASKEITGIKKGVLLDRVFRAEGDVISQMFLPFLVISSDQKNPAHTLTFASKEDIVRRFSLS